MWRTAFTLLVAFCSLTSVAQFEYPSEKGFEGQGKIQVVPHPKHSVGMKSVPKSSPITKGMELNFESSIEKAQSSGADFWIIETVKDFDGKREHYLSFGRPSESYVMRAKERPFYVPASEFEVLAELRVDSALLIEPGMQEIYLNSLLRYIQDGQKRGDQELKNYYKTAFYLEELSAVYFLEQHLDKMFKMEGALQRAFPEGRVLAAGEKRTELIPSEIWKEERSALFLISEVTIEGERYALKQLFSLTKGMLYAELRALEATESALTVAADISPLRYKPVEKEMNEIKQGTWSGPVKKKN